MPVGCSPAEMCNPSECVCEPCIEPDPKSIQVIDHDGFVIPICQLVLAGPDACQDQHWHGAGYGIDPINSAITFFTQPDPDCGFGKLADKPAMSFSLSGELACRLLALNVPCIGGP